MNPDDKIDKEGNEIVKENPFDVTRVKNSRVRK